MTDKYKDAISDAIATVRAVDASDFVNRLEEMNAINAKIPGMIEHARSTFFNLPAIEIPPEAYTSFEYFADLTESTAEGAQLLGEWFGELTFQQAVAVFPLLRNPVPKAPGRPKGSGKRNAEIERAEVTLRTALGRNPTISEVARQVALATGGHSQVKSIRRDIHRRRGVTKTPE